MPAPTVLRFYPLKRKNFLTFYPKTQLFYLQKYHFQDLRSSKCPTFRFWEVQKVPLSGFESPDLLQIRLFDHLLKPKMSHFQDLWSSKVPLPGFEKLKKSHFQDLRAQIYPNFKGTDPKCPTFRICEVQKCHFQVLRSSKSPTFRIWEPRFTQISGEQTQNVPLSGFEELKKSHF